MDGNKKPSGYIHAFTNGLSLSMIFFAATAFTPLSSGHWDLYPATRRKQFMQSTRLKKIAKLAISKPAHAESICELKCFLFVCVCHIF